MYHFIINPKSSSGRGIQYWWTVKKELDRLDIKHTAIFTKYTGHATKLARQICINNTGIKNIIILGGDGTFNEVINGIPDFSEVLFGYIPSGSSNDLARSLKIPKDPRIGLANILKPTRFKYLDHGVIYFPDNNVPPRRFACSSSIGYDANVCTEVQSSPLKKRFNRFGAGKFIYFTIAIKQLFTSTSYNATVIVNGTKKDTYKNVLLVSSMIHKYEGGGTLMAPHADPCDGKLSVCLVHGISKLKAFVLLPTIIIGKHIHFKGIEAFHCTDIEIIADNSSSVHTDGEVPSICSHIKVESVPGQIRMIL